MNQTLINDFLNQQIEAKLALKNTMLKKERKLDI